MRIRFHRAARAAPDVIDGLKVPYSAAKRNAPKWRWRLILIAVLSPAILLVFGALRSVLTLSANGTVFLEQHEVRAPAAGRLADVSVRLGVEVAAGEILARLQDVELDAAIAEAERMQHQPTVLPTVRERHLLQAEIELHERALQAQQERARVMEHLVQEGAATAAELREVRFAVDQATASLLRVRQLAAPNREPARPSTAILDASKRELARLIAKRERLVIRASESGRIVDLLAAPGEFVAAGQPLLLIGRSLAPQVIAYVSPEIAPKLSVGSRATIKFPDGTKSQASVAEQPMLTRRMPADLVDQFGLRPMTVVLHLQADQQWPVSQRIHGLPVTVRFHYSWEPGRDATRSASTTAESERRTADRGR